MNRRPIQLALIYLIFDKHLHYLYCIIVDVTFTSLLGERLHINCSPPQTELKEVDCYQVELFRYLKHFVTNLITWGYLVCLAKFRTVHWR